MSRFFRKLYKPNKNPYFHCSVFTAVSFFCVYLKSAPAASSVGPWWCVTSCKGILRPVIDLCHTAFLSSLPQSQHSTFPYWIGSKSGFPMKLQLRFKQIHHCNHDNNSFFVLSSSIRKKNSFI